jgi:flavin-binding protein dodecin
VQEQEGRHKGPACVKEDHSSYLAMTTSPTKTLQTMAILKVIEILASSKTSWEDAAANAVKEAGRTVRGIRAVYVENQSAVVVKNKITEYRVNCKISFAIEK